MTVGNWQAGVALFIAGQMPVLFVSSGPGPAEAHPGATSAPSSSPPLRVPGSFNPLHDGHRQMAAVAQTLTGHPVTFELSIENVDKPTLGEAEIVRRCRQFLGHHPLVLTRAQKFAEKARLFPGTTFIVGADTIQRVGNSGYYKCAADFVAALDCFVDLNCRFLVFGRHDIDKFVGLDSIPLPDRLRGRCIEVAESEFRMDISSTELRGDAE
ncbi:MAG: hypothetical protein KDA60_00375 [Planctomycetales bacterium]|nr:hypothetical protein [Planctomycetales bacterium]